MRFHPVFFYEDNGQVMFVGVGLAVEWKGSLQFRGFK